MIDDRFEDVIRRNAVAVVPEIDLAAFTSDRTLSDMGCNSIDRADIVTMVMEELGVTVPLESFAQSHTLTDLARLLRANA